MGPSPTSGKCMSNGRQHRLLWKLICDNSRSIAQWFERLTAYQQVLGSSPGVPSPDMRAKSYNIVVRPHCSTAHGQRGREVTVMDSGSIGFCPQGFESFRCRLRRLWRSRVWAPKLCCTARLSQCWATRKASTAQW